MTTDIIDLDAFNNDLLRSKRFRRKLQRRKRTAIAKTIRRPNTGNLHRVERIQNLLEMQRGGKLRELRNMNISLANRRMRLGKSFEERFGRSFSQLNKKRR